MRRRDLGDGRCGIIRSAQKLGAETDKAGRVLVNNDLERSESKEHFRHRRHGAFETGKRRNCSRRCSGGDSDGAARVQKYIKRFEKRTARRLQILGQRFDGDDRKKPRNC